MRDVRRIGEYYPGLVVDSPECMDKLGVSLAHLESKCTKLLRLGGSGTRVLP